MAFIAAIDPGKQRCGWAWGSQLTGQVLACGLWTHGEPNPFKSRITERVYLEHMQDRQEVPPQDLIDVAITGSYLAGFSGGELRLLVPRDWKGTVVKEVMLDRIVGRLDVEERALFEGVKCRKSWKHNVVDAIGIVLHVCGRL